MEAGFIPIYTRQVELVRDMTHIITFIPIKAAKIGNFVELPEEGGFWKVINLWGINVEY